MISVDSAKTRDALRRLAGAIHVAAEFTKRDAMLVAVAEAKATDLWNDQRPVTRGTIRVEGNNVVAGGAAHFLEWGTKPHVITAVNGRALRFMVNGSAVYRRTVNHPGTAARPFLRHARDRATIAAEFAADIHVSYAIEHAH